MEELGEEAEEEMAELEDFVMQDGEDARRGTTTEVEIVEEEQ